MNSYQPPQQFQFGNGQPRQIAQALRQKPAQAGSGGPLASQMYQTGGDLSGGNNYGFGGASDQPDYSGMGDTAKKLWDAGSSFFGGGGGTVEAGMAPGSASNPFSSMMGSNAFGGSSAAGAGGSGFMASAGPIAAAIAGGLAVDQLTNESDKDKWYNADKLNSYGTVNMGGKDIGLRGGDFINGINPATWLSDPNKAQKGLLNAFTLGLFD